MQINITANFAQLAQRLRDALARYVITRDAYRYRRPDNDQTRATTRTNEDQWRRANSQN